MKIGTLLVASALLWSGAAFAEPLKTVKGTMEVGGNVSFVLDIDGNSSQTGFKLVFMPTAGYFLLDSLEIRALVMVDAGFGDLYDQAEGGDTGWAVGGGARYFIPIGNMNVYAGLDLALGKPMLDLDLDAPPVASPNTGLKLIASGGVFIPFNKNIALDLGLRLSFLYLFDAKGAYVLEVPIGYLGIAGFF